MAFGVQQFGNTATDQHLEGSCGNVGAYRSYWLLPVLAGDKLTINWESSAAPHTELKIVPVGTTDFTYFQIEPVVSEELASNAKNQAQYTAPTTGDMPLVFRVCQYYEGNPGPYDFTATDQHALSAALTPVSHILKTGTIGGSANLADGTSAPDGLVFHLVAKWRNGSELHRATTATAAAGGQLSFQLSLPGETAGKTVRLAIGRAEDPSYQATRSVPISVKVAGRPVHHHRRRHHHRRHHHRRA